MAEVIGIGTGVIALSKSCFSLYLLLKGVKGAPKIVHDLLLALEDFAGVLESLKEAADKNPEGFAGLEDLLKHCVEACNGFRELILDCSSNSDEQRVSIRDWAKLKFKGDDIAQFKDTLTSFKSTLNIALSAATWLTATANSRDLDEFKQVMETMAKLQQDVQRFDNKLMPFVVPEGRISDEEAAEREWIRWKRNKTRECIAICAEVSKHVDKFRRQILDDVATSREACPMKFADLGDFTAQEVTTDKFEDFLTSVTNMMSKFQGQVQKFEEDGSSFSTTTKPHDDIGTQRRDQEAVKQCLTFCSRLFDQVEQAQLNSFSDISAAEKADQIITTTTEGDVVHARGISAATNARQWLGPINGLTLQQLSRDRANSRTLE